MFNDHAFWEIIHASRHCIDSSKGDAANDASQNEALAKILRLQPQEVVAAFCQAHYKFSQQAYRWDILRAAMLVEGGCGDDGFMDFRAWLISQGQKCFETVLRNPDELVRIAHQGCSRSCFAPDFSSVAPRVYEEMTGEELPDNLVPLPAEMPLGKSFPFLPREMSARFPRLWAWYGQNCP